jgi:hypothetical protein
MKIQQVIEVENFIDSNLIKLQNAHNTNQTNKFNEKEEKYVFAFDSTFSKNSNVSYHSKKSYK